MAKSASGKARAQKPPAKGVVYFRAHETDMAIVRKVAWLERKTTSALLAEIVADWAKCHGETRLAAAQRAIAQ